MKVVICTMPMKPPKEVEAVIYPVYGNKAIEYDKPVRSPVNAILAKTLKKGEKVRVIYVMTTGEHSHCEENKKIFIEELERVNAEIGAVLSYDTVEMEFMATKQTYNKLITDLTDKIRDLTDKNPENAELYVDITYGFKPEILSLVCALRFVEEFSNADVEYFIYGKADFKYDKKTEQKEIVNPMIFDITSLYHLDKLIGSIGAADADKASKILKDFFAL